MGLRKVSDKSPVKRYKAKGFDNVTIGSTAINGSAYQVPSNFSNTVATGYKALYKWTQK